jgi:hypothetical protein
MVSKYTFHHILDQMKRVGITDLRHTPDYHEMKTLKVSEKGKNRDKKIITAANLKKASEKASIMEKVREAGISDDWNTRQVY